MADLLGFRVRNQNRILQIDGEYKNLEFVMSRTDTMNSKDNNIEGYYTSISIPAGRTNATIAVISQSVGVYVKRQSNSEFRIYSTPSQAGQVVTFFMFADPTEAPSGGVGLVVRNRYSGEVVYNSNKKYMRVLGFSRVSLQRGQTASFNYPGRTVAIMQSRRPYSRSTETGGSPSQPIGIFGFQSGTMRSSGGNCVISHEPAYAGVGGNAGNTLSSSPDGAYLFIDVTGY